MSLILKGYRITPLKDGAERIFAVYDQGGTIYEQEIIIPAERLTSSNKLSSGSLIPSRRSRIKRDFVQSVNALEWINAGEGRADNIYRVYDREEGEFCAAEIVQRPTQTDAWQIGIVNPDGYGNAARIVFRDDEFFAKIEVNCELENDADGTVGIGYLTTDANFGGILTWTLAAGDASREISVNDGTSTTAYDISPGTGPLTCSGSNCRTVAAGDLTYTGANGDAFAAAFNQMIINALENAGYEYGVDFYCDAFYDTGVLKVRFYNKNNPTTLLYIRNGASGLTQNGLTRGGLPVTPDSDVNSVFYRERTAFDPASFLFNCSGDTPCSTLTSVQSVGLTGISGSRWGVTGIGSAFISGSPVTSNCASSKLTVKTEEDVVSYLWSTGEQTDEIYVQAKGAYWCDLVTARGCEIRAQIHVTEI